MCFVMSYECNECRSLLENLAKTRSTGLKLITYFYFMKVYVLLCKIMNIAEDGMTVTLMNKWPLIKTDSKNSKS
jgi:hypothetical protein